ncbi:MAG: hypothetical protein LUD77_08950 [Clostridiales bacterium]|nr:hypothetical protein [Clostridiales bacterium]
MKRFIALSAAVSIMTTSVFASEITVVLDGAQVEFSSQEPGYCRGQNTDTIERCF